MPKTVKYQSSTQLTQFRFSKELQPERDIPSWLTWSILLSIPIAIVSNIYHKNPRYLVNSLTYGNGHNLHSYTNEAIVIKELLKNGSTNFWFNYASLGTPMSLDLPPLPTFMTAILMILFEKYCSPFLVMRLIIVFLVSIIPLTWYKGARSFMLSRFNSLVISFLVLMMDSQFQNGIELDAIFANGLYSNLFGIVFLPILASKVYQYGMNINLKSQSPVYLLSLMYLCNKTIGLYCTLLAFISCMVLLITKEFANFYIKTFAKKFIWLHVGVCLYISWWTIPAMITYPYLDHRHDNYNILQSSQSMLDWYTNGHLYDFKQQYIWFTCLATLGLLFTLYDVWTERNKSFTYLSPTKTLSLWLLTSVVYFIAVFLGKSVTKSFTWIIPLTFDTDSFQLLHIHFCGVLFAAKSITHMKDCIVNFIDKSRRKKVVQIGITVLLSTILIKNVADRISRKTSLIVVNNKFTEALETLKNNFSDGRLLTHHKLGTGGSWDMTNIPFLTGLKPPSTHFNHGLSGFYMDVMTTDNQTPEQYNTHLKLYNIHYLAISTLYLEHSTINLENLVHIRTVDDIQFYKIDPDEMEYGYFGFVRLPGYIDGNLDDIRESVVTSLTLYSKDVLLYLNPRKRHGIRERSILSVQVSHPNFFERATSHDFSLVNWKLNGIDTHSVEAIKNIYNKYESITLSSRVIEELRLATEYHAIVTIKDDQRGCQEDTIEKALQKEHLLLKVSYHPFWRCIYFPVGVNYKLEKYINQPILPRKRQSIAINHVTPNLMAVSLPPGRYHVIFIYRLPGIFKLVALICIVIFASNFMDLQGEMYAHLFLTYAWNKLILIVIYIIWHGLRFSVSLFHNACNLVVPYSVQKVLSFLAAPILSVKRQYSIHMISSAKEFAVYKISVDAVSKTWNAVYEATSSIFAKIESDYERLILNVPSLPVTEVENINSKESCDTFLSAANSSVNIAPGDVSYSDIDSSFPCDALFSKVSPPTPPKHTKKSIRKRHARMSTGSQSSTYTPTSEYEPFKASVRRSSPVISNILVSLRQNSRESSPTLRNSRELSPTLRSSRELSPNLRSSRESSPTLQNSRELSQTAADKPLTTSSRKTSTDENEFYSMSNVRKSVSVLPKGSSPQAVRRDTMVPNDSYEAARRYESHLDTLNAQNGANYENITFQPAYSPRDSLNRDLFGKENNYYDNLIESVPNPHVYYNNLIDSIPNPHSNYDSSEEDLENDYLGLHRNTSNAEHADSMETIGTGQDVDDYTVDAEPHEDGVQGSSSSEEAVHLDDLHEGSSSNAYPEVFSPEHSSSPDLSRSGEHLQPYDGATSVESTFQYPPSDNFDKTKKRETLANADLYEYHVPSGSSTIKRDKKRRHTVHFLEPNAAPTTTLPIKRRTTLPAAWQPTELGSYQPATQSSLKMKTLEDDVR